MKAITLWQPWATLVALGEKRVETRSWATSYRGPIAIHAAQRKPEWTGNEVIRRALAFHGYEDDTYDGAVRQLLPRGRVVAVAELVDVREMTHELIHDQDPKEVWLGTWEPGRFAWFLENVRKIEPPVPARGRQQLWHWEEPR